VFCAVLAWAAVGDLFSAGPNDELRITDDKTYVNARLYGVEGRDVALSLIADEGDDNADTWAIYHEATDNDLYFKNYTTTALQLGGDGAVTVIGDLTVDNDGDHGLLTIEGFSDKDAYIVLDADKGDDNTDTWTIKAEQSDNDLNFYNHTSVRLGVAATGQPLGTWGVGAKNGATVTAVEEGFGPIHKTILTCNDTPIIVVGASGNGFGGVKVYDFPAGHIKSLGCVVNDFTVTCGDGMTVGTADGDFGIGSAVIGDADMGDTTDDNWLTSVALDAPNFGTATDGNHTTDAAVDGSTAAADVFVNMLVDDADIGGTVTNTFDATITITWVNLGDD